MSIETIPGSNLQYGLISFDRDGREVPEGGRLMSQELIAKAVADKVTNVFFFCHGWKGDIPAAKDQYSRWIKAFAESRDMARAPGAFPGFHPLYIGLHWPSLPFGDEEVGGSSFEVGVASPGADTLLRNYLDRLGDRPEIRLPLEIIIGEARHNSAPDELPESVRKAYFDLNDALELKSEGVDAPPDADREGFDPDVSFDAGREAGSFDGRIFDFGGLLGPLRQLSYWSMKKRARAIGEGGMHVFLKDLQTATAASGARIHLMGHSFGTIVVSGMLGGPSAKGVLPRPVDSVALVQGAVSLWCYTDAIPFDGAGPGYFSRLLADRKVGGPIVTTQSKHDLAVGVIYPLASRISGSANFGPGEFPEFGAIGAFGLQGIPDASRSELEMLAETGAYQLQRGKVYNVDGSQFIAKMDGVSGAHSDIAGPEVAHLIWAAALA